ncbi:hypothetical protein EPH95_03885 [Salicibibacter halophilus]|uniref:Abi family protein n=1 Tax=Salicibibacter halophilus TaxID=2502791 RepID=A0A514LEZ4_9BACI|nr:Abi family protein [Salicibibacter halophilus]QDI90427.1 hypothetical protein EPH95_03885 [Salicibibacter halophilus]
MQNSKPTKVFKIFEQQIEILENRNLIINDYDFALDVMKSINYYRFTGYLIPFKNKHDTYVPGTTFEQIDRIYEFDRKLRLLLFQLLESIELKFRVAVSHYFSELYHPTAYEDSSYFQQPHLHKKFYDRYKSYRNSSDELFIRHHIEKQQGIPFWVAVEIIPFGTLSRLYLNMEKNDRVYIAKSAYGLHSKYISSYMNCFSTLRNACTHFNRIYDKRFPITPKLPTPILKKFNPSMIFYKILLAMKTILSESTFNISMNNLSALIEEYEDVIVLHRIGLPEDWYDKITTH